MRIIQFLTIVGCLSMATACSSYYASNGNKQYLQSRNGANLVVPPPLSRDNISSFYDIPTPSGPTRVRVRPPRA